MKKAQSKNTTGLLISSVIFLFFGEGVFSAGLYWPILLSLSVGWPKIYWFAFLFGLILSLITVTPLGLASLVLVAGLFLFTRVLSAAGNNLWFLFLSVAVLSFVTDLALSLSWSPLELLLNLLLVFVLWRLNLFDNDLSLRGGG